MEETISIKNIVRILRERMVLIFICIFVGLALAGSVTFFLITPKFSSQAQLIVKMPRTDNAAGTGDVNTNLLMINTYKDMIKGDLVMNTVKDHLKAEYDLDKSVNGLKSSVQVIQSKNSQMFSIVATGTNAIDAKHIANMTARVFQESAKDVLDVDKISITSNARANTTQVSPNNKLNLAIGLVLGMMVGGGLTFLLEFFDRTVKNSQFITEDLDFIILGTVSEMSTKELKNSIKPEMPKNKALSQPDETNDNEKISRRKRPRV